MSHMVAIETKVYEPQAITAASVGPNPKSAWRLPTGQVFVVSF